MKKRYFALLAAGTLAASTLVLTSCGDSTTADDVETNFEAYTDDDKITSKQDFDTKLKLMSALETAYESNCYNTEKGQYNDYVYTGKTLENNITTKLDVNSSSTENSEYTITYDSTSDVKQYDLTEKATTEENDGSTSVDLKYTFYEFTNDDDDTVYVNTTTKQYYDYAEKPSLYIKDVTDTEYDSKNTYYYSTVDGKSIFTIISDTTNKNAYMDTTETKIIQYILSGTYYGYKYSSISEMNTINSSESHHEYTEYAMEVKDTTVNKIAGYATMEYNPWGY